MAQKTLIQIIQTVANELNLPQPAIVMSSQDQNVLKMLAFARAVNDDLLSEFDWQVLNKRYTFNTVANQESYAFPTDIDRWLDSSFFNSTNRWPLVGPLTPSQWEWTLLNYAVGGPFTRYRVYGGLFHVQPVPTASTTTFSFEYISNSTVINGNTGVGQLDYTQDSDIAALDHRMIVYGIKYKYLASIGQDTTNALTEYRRAVESQKAQDIPGLTLSMSTQSGVVMLNSNNYPDGSWA